MVGLYAKVLNGVHVYTSDSAAAEQLAGDLLKDPNCEHEIIISASSRVCMPRGLCRPRLPAPPSHHHPVLFLTPFHRMCSSSSPASLPPSPHPSISLAILARPPGARPRPSPGPRDEDAKKSKHAGCLTKDLLPNLKKVAQDKPHGVRRVVSRAWAADKYLDDTAHIMILEKGSITSLIQNSNTFKSFFQNHNQTLEACPVQAARVRDLNFAKHRFNC